MQRRSVVAVFSILLHAIVLLFLMTADLWRPIAEWPAPRSAMAFVEPPRPVHLEDIVLPRERRPGAAAPATPSPGTHSIEPAPIVPPSGTANETESEGVIRSSRDGSGGPGTLIGIETGGNGFGSIGPPAPPAPPPAPAPIHLHSGIRPPQRIVNAVPVYPMAARAARVEGVVIIEATIDAQGSVMQANVLRSIPLLDDAAVAAVRRWKFSPTLLNGVPVPIVMTVTVNFTLAP